MAKLKPPLAVGLFEDPEKLLKAASQAKEKGFKNLDAYTPYPVPGLQEALGIKSSWVPYATLVAGFSGASLIYLFMYWTSVINWPVNVGGKPFHSWPTFIPITFEGGVLLGGVTTFIALLVACGLPKGKPFIIDPNLTNDQLALVIPEKENTGIGDPTAFLKEIGAYEVKRIVA